MLAGDRGKETGDRGQGDDLKDQIFWWEKNKFINSVVDDTCKKIYVQHLCIFYNMNPYLVKIWLYTLNIQMSWKDEIQKCLGTVKSGSVFA